MLPVNATTGKPAGWPFYLNHVLRIPVVKLPLRLTGVDPTRYQFLFN